jgi:hypothetical protein
MSEQEATKPLLSPKIQAIEDRRVRRNKKQQEKRTAAKAAKLALLPPPPPEPIVVIKKDTKFQPGQSGNPGGRPKHVREALEKCIVLARASKECPDKSKLEALIDRIYERAMDEKQDLDLILEAAKFIAERLEGKPSADPAEAATGTPALVVNIGTRFNAADPRPQVEVLEAKVVKNG